MAYVTATNTKGSVSLSPAVVRAWHEMPFPFPDRVLLLKDPQTGFFCLSPTDEETDDTRAVTQKGARVYITCTALHSAIQEYANAGPFDAVRCPGAIVDGDVMFDAEEGRTVDEADPVLPGDVLA